MSSTDPAGSRDFYAGLFGWTYEIDAYSGRGHYATALLGGWPVAGVVGVPVVARQPVAWSLYLASANIHYTAGVFRRGGGLVLSGPVDVPRQGRWFGGADPTGAEVRFWQPAKRWEFHTTDPGSLYWAELNTWDGAGADKFFASLFGYRQQQFGDGIEVDYAIWSVGGRTILGRLQMDEGWAAPDVAAHWMLHFAVDPHTGTDEAVTRVLELGGEVDVDPYDTELGRIARVIDPFGAAFALIDSTDRLEPATDLSAGSARVDDPYDD
ncbi:MAG TPA: VOC family protein [Pseudonocardiaceae bacterium]